MRIQKLQLIRHFATNKKFSQFNYYYLIQSVIDCPVVIISDYRITANSFLCYCCGLRTFREIAYKYRERIPPSELPGKTRMR